MSRIVFEKLSWADMEEMDEVNTPEVPVIPEAPKAPKIVSKEFSWISVAKIGIQEPVQEESPKEPSKESLKEEPVQESPKSKGFSLILCVDCKNSFKFYDTKREEFAKKGFQMPKRCFDCKTKRDISCDMITCKKCCKAFPFTESQKAEYKKKGYKTPKVCKQCRN